MPGEWDVVSTEPADPWRVVETTPARSARMTPEQQRAFDTLEGNRVAFEGLAAVDRVRRTRPTGLDRARRVYGRDRAPAPWDSDRRPGVHNNIGNQIIASTGITDEVGGALAYGAQSAVNVFRRLAGRPVEMSAADAYNAAAEAERGAREEYAREHPAMNVLATVGGIATAAPAAAGRGVIAVLPNTTRVGRAVNAGANAAVASAPIAYANQEGSVADRLPGTLEGAAVGGVMGAGLQFGGEALSSIASRLRANPPSPSAARVLSNAGVNNLTPGEMLGGGAQRVEDSLQSVPFLGDAIKSAQRRAVGQYNRVEVDRALAPIQARLPRNIRPGRDAIAYADNAVSQAYGRALGPVQSIPPTPRMHSDIQIAVNGVAHSGQRAHAQGIADDIMQRFQRPLTGDEWKELDSDIVTEIGLAMRSQEPGARQLVRALQTIRDQIRQPLQAVNPQAFAAVRRADAAFARMERIGRASERAGTAARDGLVSPAQMDAEVRLGARGTHQYRQGQALGQDLTDPAMQVLPQTVPDSGTPMRAIVQGAGALAAGAGAHALGPQATATAALGAAGIGAGAALYSRPVIGALNVIYRATGRVPSGQVEAALGVLAQEAARNPALAPVYQQALDHVRQPATQQQGSPRQAEPTLR